MHSHQVRHSPSAKKRPVNAAIVLALVACMLWWASTVSGKENAPPESQKMNQHFGQWRCPEKNQIEKQAYLAYLPRTWGGDRRLPVLVVLAGAATMGKDQEKLYLAEIPKLIRAGREFDALILCGQVPNYWKPSQAEAFLRQIQELYAGMYDPDRIYVTGHDTAGHAVWELAKRTPGQLAAIVPITNTQNRPEEAEKLVDLPIWAFHSALDKKQPPSQTRNLVKAIEAAGGKYVRYTEFEEEPHAKAGTTAHQLAYREEALWKWLFRQHRGRPELSLEGKDHTDGPK